MTAQAEKQSRKDLSGKTNVCYASLKRFEHLDELYHRGGYPTENAQRS